MSEKEDILADIVWGSRLFINSQFVSKLVVTLAHYYQGKCTLSYLLQFIRALQKQKKVKLYVELQRELEEFMQIEKFLHDENREQNVIIYAVNRLFKNITQGRFRTNV